MIKKKKNKDDVKIKDFKKEKLKFMNNKLDILKNSINNFSKNVPLYNIILDSKESIKTDSFYDMYFYDTDKIDNNKYIFDIEKIDIPKNIFKCKKICLQLTTQQSKDLIKMMDGYRNVYNLTIKFIKQREYLRKEKENLNKNIIIVKEKDVKKKNLILNKDYKEVKNILDNIIGVISKEEDIKERQIKRRENISNFIKDDNYEMILDYKILRTYFLKDIINDISKKYKTPIHSLNKAVELACISFKSAITNLRNGKIKNFRIRPIKSNKSSLLMDIEKGSFTKDGKSFIKSILGNEILNKNNIKYNFKNDCKIHYNKDTKKFILLVPEKINIEENENNNYISIDPGLRTFLNCTTNNKYIEIGNNIKDELKILIKRIDKVSNIKKNKLKNRYLKILRSRIKQKVNDMHWKIIYYLTNTYKTIIIGKWSTKSIISKNNKIFNGINKRIIQNLSFYSFLEKLKYKCLIRNVNLKLVEEYYTSKVCSCCGNIKNNLKGEKVYNCNKCKIVINRDYNGSRNIFLKSIKSIV